MTERWVKMVEKWHKKNPSAMGLLTDDGAVTLLARQHRAFVRMVRKVKKIETLQCYSADERAIYSVVRLSDVLAALAKQGGGKK